MEHIWHFLGGNLAAVGLVISMWVHVSARLRALPKLQEQCLWGGFIGIAVMTSMLMSVELRPGIFIDLRSLIATAGLFGGPVAALLALTMAAICRLYIGGAGADIGVIAITVHTSIGLLAGAAVRFRPIGVFHVLGVSIAVAVTTVLMLSFMTAMSEANALALAPPLVTLSVTAIWLCSAVRLWVQAREHERNLVRAAFAQTPDFLYIKDRQSKFVMTNNNTAKYHHVLTADAMIGLSDFSLTSRPRAEELYEAEQDIIRTGKPLIDYQEEIEGKTFISSKVPISDGNGVIIGLAGVTRDITQRVKLEHDLRESKNLLSYAMAGMSDGFALFDKRGFLVFCNDQYREAFPRSGDARTPGTHISDILHRVVQTQERADTPETAPEDWVKTAAAAMYSDKDHEIELFNGHWLSVRTRSGEQGSAIVLVSDITATKQAEETLRQSAETLRALAHTDALTGIMNRRSFDDEMTIQIASAVRNRAKLSIMMLDVDRFKAYNDTYGHQAGDLCLQEISECLRLTCNRAVDIVARYGGEEFVAILPNTDERGALVVAERFARMLETRQLVHTASEFGYVTASVGVATGNTRSGKLDGTALIKMADAALYEAKHRGRNQACTWLMSQAIPQAIA